MSACDKFWVSMPIPNAECSMPNAVPEQKGHDQGPLLFRCARPPQRGPPSASEPLALSWNLVIAFGIEVPFAAFMHRTGDHRLELHIGGVDPLNSCPGALARLVAAGMAIGVERRARSRNMVRSASAVKSGVE